jgi:hypothetical protein
VKILPQVSAAKILPQVSAAKILPQNFFAAGRIFAPSL